MKPTFVASFTTAQDLIDDISKCYKISWAMKDEIIELWEDNLWESDNKSADLPF